MRILGFIGYLGFLGFFVGATIPSAVAAGPLTYRHLHFLFTLDPATHPEWLSHAEKWTWNGTPLQPPPSWKVDGDVVPPLPAGVTREDAIAWDRDAIRRTIENVIGKALARPAGDVIIHRTETGGIVFDGVGLTGREVDLGIAADLTVAALEQNLTEIELPVIETQPKIRVTDPELVKQGIKEVVTIGESDFSRSPDNRRKNIAVGLKKFKGHLIPAGGVFSFDTVLGPVDGTTGFVKELVIKGDRTEPDYGGGLCQVSTTAYRGVWEYGFPILKRKNHSYTVSHYSPPGTDATVYPGSADMVFRNDLSHALLIQTYAKGNLAYFIYYGTRDARKTDLVGPFVYDKTPPPPNKTELSIDIPPGTTKKLNERVPGLKALWYRFLQPETGSGKMETVFSQYEARPLFTAIGVSQLPEGYKGPSGADLFIDDIAPSVPGESSSSESTSALQTSSTSSTSSAKELPFIQLKFPH